MILSEGCIPSDYIMYFVMTVKGGSVDDIDNGRTHSSIKLWLNLPCPWIYIGKECKKIIAHSPHFRRLFYERYIMGYPSIGSTSYKNILY